MLEAFMTSLNGREKSKSVKVGMEESIHLGCSNAKEAASIY